MATTLRDVDAKANAWNHRLPFVEGVQPTAGTRFIDRTGERYGKLVVTSLAGKQGTLYKWNCRCDCGGSRVCFGNVLRQGKYTDCGCQSRLTTRKYGVKSSDPTYRAWLNMCAACYSPNSQAYEHVGAMGIRVCARWGESFAAFREDMGDKPIRTQLSRKDDRADFSPDNCFWAKLGEIAPSRAARYEFNGKRLTLAQWAKELGITRQRVDQRLKKMPVEIALSYGKCANWQDSPLNRSRPKVYQKRRADGGGPSLSREERALRRSQMRELRAQGMTVAKIAAWFGVTKETVFLAIGERH